MRHSSFTIFFFVYVFNLESNILGNEFKKGLNFLLFDLSQPRNAFSQYAPSIGKDIFLYLFFSIISLKQ